MERILTNDTAEVVNKKVLDRLGVIDDERWITIGGKDEDGGGHHVLIKENGTIIQGFGKGKNVKNAFGGKSENGDTDSEKHSDYRSWKESKEKDDSTSNENPDRKWVTSATEKAKRLGFIQKHGKTPEEYEDEVKELESYVKGAVERRNRGETSWEQFLKEYSDGLKKHKADKEKQMAEMEKRVAENRKSREQSMSDLMDKYDAVNKKFEEAKTPRERIDAMKERSAIGKQFQSNYGMSPFEYWKKYRQNAGKSKKGSAKDSMIGDEDTIKALESLGLVDDEERWVTINGRHVLIKNGEAQFGGVKISKAPNNFKGGRFVNSEKEFDEAGEKFEKAYKRENERLKRETEKIDSDYNKERANYRFGTNKYADMYLRMKKKDPAKYNKLMNRIMERVEELATEWGLAAEKYDEADNRVRKASEIRKKKLEKEYDDAIKKWLSRTVNVRSQLKNARKKIQAARQAKKR